MARVVDGIDERAMRHLAQAGAAVAEMKMHPGWEVFLELMGRLEAEALERMGDCSPDELPRLQGERDAVRSLRRALDTLPAKAAEALESAVEDGDITDEQLERYITRVGDGDLRV